MGPSNPTEEGEGDLLQLQARYRDLQAASDRYTQALKAVEDAPEGSEARASLGAEALGAFMLLAAETYR